MGETQGNEAVYRHVRLSGTPYEIGKKEAELVLLHYPEEAGFWIGGNDAIRPGSPESVRAAIRMFDRYCPRINEEIQGFADTFRRSPEEVIFYSFSAVSHGNCGHFAVLPPKSADGHTYVGRSYEWSEDDDKRLLTVKAEGAYAHLGFSLLLFGRYEGINEKGLCVTMSAGIPMAMSKAEGLRFWMVIRILLDSCADVEEAIACIRELPVSAYTSLIFADRNGHAALVEICDSVLSVRRIQAGTGASTVASTNHYVLPEMQGLVRNRMRQSVDRFDAITRTLAPDHVEPNDLKKLLSTQMPEGLACHYYRDGLGTLWSMLFDVTEGTAEVCFGSPVSNPWRTFGLEGEDGMTEYLAVLPNRESARETWERV